MPILNYSILQDKNTGLPISATELEGMFFFGISIKDQSGNRMSEQDINFNIRSAMEEMEGFLNIKMVRQVIKENVQFSRNDFRHWGYVPTTYPVACPSKLVGFLGKIEQVTYPSSWLTVKKSNDGIAYHRSMYMVPSSDAVAVDNNSVIYSGVAPHVNYYGSSQVPFYWDVTYVTSFDRIPEDILMIMGKWATINIFAQLGDIILGAGIASQSLGIDGLSQSISTTSSATSSGYGSRIIQYKEDIKKSLPRLASKYKGMTLTSC